MLAALTVVGLFVIVLGANALGGWRVTPRFHLPFDLPQRTPAPFTPPMQTPGRMPSRGPLPQHEPLISADVMQTIVRVLVIIVIVAVLVFVAGVAWRVTRPGRREGEPAGIASAVPDARVEVRRAVQQARQSLRRHRHTGDVAATIIAAWSALEAVAADTGHRRRPEQTASEFTAALLTDLSGDEQTISELLGLYHRARYGTAEVVAALAEADADRADALLETLADRLEEPQDAEPGDAESVNAVGGGERREEGGP